MRQLRETATVLAGLNSIPYSNAEWLTWLEENDARFRDALRTATERRKVLGQRLTPREGGLPETPRLNPARSGIPRSGWEKKLLGKCGYFCLRLGEHATDKQLFFICSLRGMVYGWPLVE